MNYRTRSVSEFDVDGMTAELSFKPSCVMDYVDHVIERSPGLVAVGYLVDDSDVENPLESCDGLGHVFSAHRHSGKYAEMQAVLGLDSDWNSDYSLVEKQAKTALMELVRTEFQSDLVGFILERANEGDGRDEAMSYFIADFTGQLPYHKETWLAEKVRERMSWESLLDQAWIIGRAVGQVGDPYAVILDCYQHGGTSWSVSGSGMQCAFDTARGVGVWVPDQCLREDLDAINASDGLDAARSKAVEFARQALEAYNAWLGGDCYGVAVDVFSVEGGCLKRVRDSSVWGFVGRDWAEKSMLEEARGQLGNACLPIAA